MAMLTQVRASIVATVFFTLLLGVGYPLLVTVIGRAAFPAQADGSLIRDSTGRVIGSALLAQGFVKPQYLHPRPSAAGADGYDASASSGSNLGPLNPALLDRVKASANSLKAEAGGAPIPADALTTSASGLDPDISPANARMQAARIAAARGVSVDKVRALLDHRVLPPVLGTIGQPTVNVLEANLALDAAFGRAQPQAR
jgi:K+-transporting ATPase ATPase C chain